MQVFLRRRRERSCARDEVFPHEIKEMSCKWASAVTFGRGSAIANGIGWRRRLRGHSFRGSRAGRRRRCSPTWFFCGWLFTRSALHGRSFFRACFSFRRPSRSRRLIIEDSLEPRSISHHFSQSFGNDEAAFSTFDDGRYELLVYVCVEPNGHSNGQAAVVTWFCSSFNPWTHVPSVWVVNEIFSSGRS